jgi:rSAM/selenodomain-associated transferase 1
MSRFDVTMSKALGIFVRTPVPGTVKTRLAAVIGEEAACDLYAAFLRDLFRRLHPVKGAGVTVFHEGDDPQTLEPIVPRGWRLLPQNGADLGQRLRAATSSLLERCDRAVIIGSDSPDLPVQYIRRAFQRLKHKDVVLGPAADGGYYLVGLRAPAPVLFEGVRWGSDAVLRQTIDNVARAGLSLHSLPVWYDVDDEPSLRLLRTMLAARRVEGRDRLVATESVLKHIDDDG